MLTESNNFRLKGLKKENKTKIDDFVQRLSLYWRKQSFNNSYSKVLATGY